MKSPTAVPRGRPRAKVDVETVAALARIHCTNEEIAAVCGCSAKLIQRRYSSIAQKAREEGRASLRRMQYAAAKNGNVAMLIWLGKQLLGQREPRIDVSAEVTTDALSGVMSVLRDVLTHRDPIALRDILGRINQLAGADVIELPAVPAIEESADGRSLQ